jgi:hypothetical protein
MAKLASPRSFRVMKSIPVLVTLAVPAVAFAQAQPAPSTVTLKSETFVARATTDAQGKAKNDLFPATRVLPGEPLVFVLSYENGGTKPASGFVINNPIPPEVSYTGVEQSWATVSVDGGKSFAPLATLKVKGADGKLRGAIPADVTNVRWTFAQPIMPKAKGRVMFYGMVK